MKDIDKLWEDTLLRFTCPGCHGHRLSYVETIQKTYSVEYISDIYGVKYGEQDNKHTSIKESVKSFRCSDCNYLLGYDMTQEQVVKWITKNCYKLVPLDYKKE